MTAIFDREVDRWSGLYGTRRAGDRRYAVFQGAAQRRAAKRLRLATELLGLEEGMTVLDVGCGSGVLRTIVSERGAVWTGIDESRGMVARGRNEVADGDPPGSWVVGSADRLPFAGESFDVIACIGVMNFVRPRRWNEIFEEFSRVLARGGAVVFTSLRLDVLTWIRSRVYPFLAPPIGTPGPLFPVAPRRVDGLLRATPFEVDRSVAVSKYLGLPHYTMYRVVLSGA